MEKIGKYTKSVFRELRRRRVAKTCLFYIVLCWGALEVGDVLIPTLEMDSEKTSQAFLYTAIAGLPVVFAFAWFFQITPQGVVRTTAFIDRRVLNNIEPLNDKRHASVTTYFRDEEEELAHRWVITAESGALKGLSFGISETVIIGRLKECDITLPSSHISRKHARFSIEEGLLMIEDLGSSNGSIVNGKILDKKHVIHHKDELLFHDMLFRVSENLAMQNGDSDASLQTTSFKPTDNSPSS